MFRIVALYTNGFLRMLLKNPGVDAPSYLEKDIKSNTVLFAFTITFWWHIIERMFYSYTRNQVAAVDTFLFLN